MEPSSKLEKFRSNIRKESLKSRFDTERKCLIKRMDFEVLCELMQRLRSNEGENYHDLNEALNLLTENISSADFVDKVTD